ncbi:MAG: phage/plasmid primase, P4 family, partial [Planctomycetota bacterium]
MNNFKRRVFKCAKAYAEKGWAVLPVHTIIEGRCTCGKADCSSAGKHPATPRGVKDATTDADQIQQWFANGRVLNIGIAAGAASGLAVLDIDPKDNGDESIKKYRVPDTLEVITGSGGKHYYFTDPEGQTGNSVGKLGRGIDVRGNNGYVVAPPSLHSSGQEYRWRIDPNARELAPVPSWLNASGSRQEVVGNRQQNDDGPIAEGKRNETLCSIAGSMRRQGCDADTIYAALIDINKRRCQPPVEFDELRKIAQSVARYATEADGIVLESDHPDIIAAAFETWSEVKHRHQVETWTIIENKKYRIVDEREIKKWIRRFGTECRVRRRVRTDEGFVMRIERLKVTPHLVRSVLEALSSLDDVWLRPRYAPPVWLAEGRKPQPEKVIALNNCLIDLSGQEPKPMDLTEDFYTVNYLPFDYDPAAACPLWKEKLNEWFQIKRLSSSETVWSEEHADFVEVYEKAPDELSISILAEWFGYCLTQQTRYQKILGLVGPKRSGKGTIGRVLRALIGRRNVTSPTLSGMTNEHGLQALHHKTLAIIPDASISGSNADSCRAVERLKSISGEDAQQINPKGKAYIEVEKLRTRFVIMSNELQKLTDPTGALANRFVYLVMTQSFYGAEDVNLEAKLMGELPGIFNWALAGYFRLQKRGWFEESEAGKEAKAMAEELGSPVIEFVREWCDVKPGKQTRCQDLYEAYGRWTHDAGRSKMGRTRFYEEFRRAFPDCARS